MGVDWWSNQGAFGLVSDLLRQAGNGGPGKLKIGYVGDPATKGNWSVAASYGAGEMRAFPINSPIMWITNASVGAGEAPPISNSKWKRAVAPEMVQSLVGGKYGRMTMQRDEGEWIKAGTFDVGTYAVSSFAYDFDDAGTAIKLNYNAGPVVNTTSADSITTPTSHPTSRTFTIGTGISASALYDSVSIGTCSDNFAIPTTHPTIMTRNLPTGLSLTKGQKITFYGDANNFFVFVVVRYSAVTGVAYGFSLLHVGSGTFSSWDLRPEALLRILRTANPTGNFFYGLVQSYDSGTGSITVKSTRNTGTGAHTGWTVTQAHEPNAPAAGQSLSYQTETSAVALFHTGTFNGTKLVHQTTIDNRGTGWRYMYAGGPLIDNPPDDVIIDTYNASSVSAQVRTTFDDLSEVGTHEFVAVSIESPSGLSANTRNWINASTVLLHSYSQQYNYDLFTADFTMIAIGFSIGEIAWKIRLNSAPGDTAEFGPYHGFEPMKSPNPVMIVDGVTIDHEATFISGLNPYQLKYQDFTTCQLNQAGDYMHSEQVTRLGTYASTHYLTRQGLSWSIQFNWEQAIFKEIAYTNMMYLRKEFCKFIVFDTGYELEVPQGADPDVDIPDAELTSKSWYAKNDGTGILGEPDYAIAQYRSSNVPWLTSSFVNNYDADEIKMYPVTGSSQVVTAGTTELVDGKIYLGNIGDL